MNLYIHSVEGGSYLAELEQAGERQYLRDANNKLRTFQSLSQIKQDLASRQYKQVWLSQDTPYDEMCGNPESASSLLIRLSWQD